MDGWCVQVGTQIPHFNTNIYMYINAIFEEDNFKLHEISVGKTFLEAVSLFKTILIILFFCMRVCILYSKQY